MLLTHSAWGALGSQEPDLQLFSVGGRSTQSQASSIYFLGEDLKELGRGERLGSKYII